MKIPFYLPGIFFCLIGASCVNSIRSWRSDTGPGTNSISFKYLNGKNTDTIYLSAGDSLLIAYKSSNNTGKLHLSVSSGGEPVWQKDIVEAVDSRITIPAVRSGKYKIKLEGRQASGDFELLYKRIRPEGNQVVTRQATQVVAGKGIQVVTNKNIELFGLIMQLDNGIDFIQSKDSVTIYGKRVSVHDWCAKTIGNYTRYKAFDSCDMMKLYRDELARGVYNDFFVHFLLEVDEVPFAKISERTNRETLLGFSPKGDPAEATRNAEAFLTMMNHFYQEVDFGAYLKENEGYYAIAKANVEKNLPPAGFIPMMEGFYQKQFNGYYLIPSLNILSGQGFGKMNKKAGIVYNTFGPFTVQSFDPAHLNIGYDRPEYIRNLSVHEFGHSFVNPAIEKVPDSLIESSAYLYEPIRETMRKLSYPSWRICLYEHFVRAGEVVIARNLGDSATADSKMKEYTESGFVYLPAIVAELEKYNHDRASYASYDAYVPLVLEKLKSSVKPRS